MCEQDYSPSAELISLILNWLKGVSYGIEPLISLVIGRKVTEFTNRSPALVNQRI
jgi:hypothetical protein